jgi:DNA-binding beta-propeller fold protein YncE
MWNSRERCFSILSTFIVISALAAFMQGCGSKAPVSIPNVVPQRQFSARSTAAGDLLYVSDTDTSDVYVFSYPKGTLQATITGLLDPAGECVDAAGNVFVTNTGASNVLEFAHGGTTPIATLDDSGYFPVGCSVDPTTGNLAVTNFSTSGSAQGDVVIYKRAKGHPTGNYTDPNIGEMLLCSYDGAGDLFVDGLTQGSAFALAELRKGTKKLRDITLDRTIQSAGGIQWDGKFLAVEDQATSVIYQFSIGGAHGTKVGSTAMRGAVQVFQFWIEGSKVIGPDAAQGNVGIWRYPAGGKPRKIIGGVYVPLGAVVSKAS